MHSMMAVVQLTGLLRRTPENLEGIARPYCASIDTHRQGHQVCKSNDNGFVNNNGLVSDNGFVKQQRFRKLRAVW
jgi:hypothetical protein